MSQRHQEPANPLSLVHIHGNKKAPQDQHDAQKEEGNRSQVLGLEEEVPHTQLLILVGRKDVWGGEEDRAAIQCGRIALQGLEREDKT